MKKGLATAVAIAAIAMLGFTGIASADEASGKIATMDVKSRTISLDDGTTYVVGEGIAIESLEPGTEVTVSYEEQGGRKVAKEVTPQ